MTEQCPCCKNNLKKMYYIGSGNPPTKEGFYNAKDWTTSKKKYREFLKEKVERKEGKDK